MENMLISHIEDKHLLLTLNRPRERNALNTTLIETLHQTLIDYRNHPDIRTVILQGAGDHFSAGADIKEMEALMQASYEENCLHAKKLAELLWQLYMYPKPTLALCQGSTMGGGIGLLACCDIVLADKQAQFAFSEVKLGIIPAIISPYIVRTIGARAMHRYFLTGERFSAEKALMLSLVHHIVKEKPLLEEGLLFARNIAANGRNALIAAKELIRENAPINHEHVIAIAERLADIRRQPEAQEGFRAFREKRLPHWD